MPSALFRSILLALIASPGAILAQLNGTYTVGPTGTYTTLTAAIAALQTNGVNGPVVMAIQSGTYTGNWTIPAITGASATNTITFRSQAMSSSAVTLNYSSTAPTFTLSGCSFVRLEDIGINGYTLGVSLVASPADIRLRRCLVSSSYSFGSGIATSTSRVDRLLIEECTVSAPYAGIGLYAPLGELCDSPIIRDNVISVGVSSGISVDRADNVLIEGNSVASTGASTSTYINGITVRNANGAIVVRGNQVNWDIGSWALFVENGVGSPGSPPLVENNMFVLGNGSASGAGVNIQNTDDLVFRHNSVRCTTTKHALQVQFSDNAVVEGNILQTMATQPLMTQTATFSSVDHNVYFCTTWSVVRWQVFTYYSLSTWQAQGWDASSVFADPLFVSTTDLHIQSGSPAQERGPMPVLVATDLDGDARGDMSSLLPDAGADERTDACSLGLNGTYLLGPSGAGLFPTFNSAVAAMASCGISGPVTFLVESGTYTEQVSIPPISGTSATNTITFRSEAMDSSAVLLTWPSSPVAANDHTLALDGADHVTFNRISIRRSGAQDWVRVIVFGGVSGSPGSQFTRFTHCQVIGNSNTAAASAALIETSGAITDSVRVDACRLVDGSDGFYWNTFSLGDKLLVEDCIITGQYISGVRITLTGSFTVRSNTIEPASPGRGIYLSGCMQGLIVHGNRIRATSNALFMANCGGAQARLYNNFFTSLGSTAVQMSNCTNLQFDHNSVGGFSYGVHLQAGTISFASFRNNALYSGGYALYRQAASSTMALSSNNLLYRVLPGPLAFWTAAQNTLAALQAASGGFANSVNADPRFYDPTVGDLHAYAMETDMAGTPIAGITTDLDGDTRSASAPDIGADEFTPQLWADVLDACGPANAITSTGSGADQWIYRDRKVVARFNDNGQALGNVQLNLYVNSGLVRTSDLGQHYLDRNWHLITQNAIGSSVSIRLFFSGAEFAAFAAADPLVSALGDAGVAQYVGVNENCSETDNPSGQQWFGLYPVTNGSEPRIASSGGTSYVVASIGNDGELYVTGQGQVLPVELVSFSATRIDDREVRLDWMTASEHRNAGFEVWRMLEGGSEFTEVGWVEGNGDSQQMMNYRFLDGNTSAQVSYYRLKQVDEDGRFSWSSVVAVEGARHASNTVIAPNPAHDELVLFGLPSDVIGIELLDATGRRAGSWSGVSRIQGLGHLERGVYTLLIRRSTDPISTRVVLQ